jgi:alkylation response protein AidB-like acyl-CoA dehydrogenase
MIHEHPAAQLQEAWIHTIRDQAKEAEAAGRLQPAQLQLAYAQQWFKMLVPEQYTGSALVLPQVVRLEEAIAWADGSMGWVVTLCSGAGWFGGFITPALAQQIFAGADACLAGSGAATGTAEILPEGYKVSGRWLHASGAPHNTIFTANCVLTEKGVPLTNEAGEPVIKPFAFYRAEVTIVDTWTSFGLVATASHAFEISNLVVPAERAFALDERSAIIDHPLYHYPFLQLAEITLAANLSGMAIHFIDEATALVPFKRAAEQTILQQAIQQATMAMQEARQSFYAAIDSSWQQLEDHKSITQSTLQEVSDAARKLAVQSRRLTDELYPYCGLAAAAKDSTINRIWRDLHTASQHSLLVFPRN